MKLRTMARLMVGMIALCCTCTISTAYSTDEVSKGSLPTDNESQIIEVRVPTDIPISVDLEGNISIPLDLKIENLSNSTNVEVTGINISSDTWELIDFSTVLLEDARNTKKLGLQFRGDNTLVGGEIRVTDGNWSIPANSELGLLAKAKLPYQDSGFRFREQIAVLEWEISVSDSADKSQETIIDRELFISNIPKETTTSITFGAQAGSDPIPLSLDGNIVAAFNGTDCYIYNTTGGKIYFPPNSKSLFYKMKALTNIDFGVDIIDMSLIKDASYMFGYLENFNGTIDLSVFDLSNLESIRYMFFSSNIEEVRFGKQNTSKLNDCDSAFSFSTIKTLDISNINTSNVVNMYRLFGHSSTANIDLSGWDTSNVTDMGEMFAYSDVEVLTFGDNFNTSNVTNMASMFEYTNKLTSLDVSKFNTSNVTDMSSMFRDCGAPDIDVSNFNTSKVTDMAGMFAFSNISGRLDLSNFDTSNVTNMASMFYYSKDIDSLDLRSFNTSKVIDMSAMFRDCSGLYSLDLGSFNLSNVENINNLINSCNAYLKVYVSSQEDMDKIKEFGGGSTTTKYEIIGSIDNMVDLGYVTRILMDNNSSKEFTLTFNEVNGTDPVIVGFDDDIVMAKNDTDYFIYNKSGENVKLPPICSGMFNSYNYGGGGYSLEIKELNFNGVDTTSVIDMSYMFYGCDLLNEIGGLNQFDTSNVTNMGRMFYNCSSLQNIDMGSFNTYNVTDMKSMFYGCRKLASLDISSLETHNVTNMSYMFFGCSALQDIDLHTLDTSNVTTMAYMFRSLKLQNIDLSNFDTSNVTDMSYMFYLCSELQTVNLSSFDTSSLTNMSFMFSECKALQNIDLSNFNTSNVTDMSSMFRGCTNLEGTNILELDTSNVTNMSYMFYKCPKIIDVDISGCNTSKVTNISYMFYECSGLESVMLGNIDFSSLTNMENTFYSCYNLESVDFSGVTLRDLSNMKSTFERCGSLVSVDLSGSDNLILKNMDRTFAYCGSLKTLDLSSLDLSETTRLYNIFYKTYGLTTCYTRSQSDCDKLANEYDYAEDAYEIFRVKDSAA